MDIFYGPTPVKGQRLNRSKTKNKPRVKLSSGLFTLMMWDPDAPQGTWLHWLVTNIPGDIARGTDVVMYAPPTPPPGTGVHRYHFTLFPQTHRISVEHVDRQDFSIQSFATRYGLQHPYAQTLFLQGA